MEITLPRKDLVPATGALAIGALQTYALLFCWAYIAAYTPVPSWLLGLGLSGIGLRLALVPIDLAIAAVLCIPGALAITWLRPRRIALYLTLAVLPSFAWLNLNLIGNPLFAEFATSFAIGWIGQLLPLPLAAWLVQRMREAPNNSFKGMPLRGTP